MTYSLDYRKQVLKSLDEGMTFAEAAAFYGISPTTIQKWKKRLHSKTTYERAQRFNCSPTGISKALKRIGVSKKKDT